MGRVPRALQQALGSGSKALLSPGHCKPRGSLGSGALPVQRPPSPAQTLRSATGLWQSLLLPKDHLHIFLLIWVLRLEFWGKLALSCSFTRLWEHHALVCESIRTFRLLQAGAEMFSAPRSPSPCPALPGARSALQEQPLLFHQRHQLGTKALVEPSLLETDHWP